MGERVSLGAVLLIGLLMQAAVRVQSDMSFQGPLDKPNGLCATFVFSQGLGYTCEEYVVQTSDGFLLGVQRMYSGQGSSPPSTPVFLNHGILLGGNSWMLNPPSNSLAFLLGEAGYDVWIGNARTTNYSSGHVTLTSNEEGYWNWSFDELAGYDLPAMLGVVSAKTDTSIHYVGYSQGTQAAVASFSEGGVLPLLGKVVLLAPAVFGNTPKTIATVAFNLYIIDQLLASGVFEIDPHSSSSVQLIDAICTSPGVTCPDDLTTALAGPNCCINDTRSPYYDQYGVATATKNLVHLGQLYRTKTFAKYDYGSAQNFQVYQSPYPPAYNVADIPPIPLLLIHGGTDGLADVQDVNLLLQTLQFTPEVVFLPNYGHVDFLIGTMANVDVYPKVVSFLSS